MREAWQHLPIHGLLLRAAMALAAALAGSVPATAEIVSKTEITYFAVTGKTPAEIYRNILDRGPTVGKDRALAAIGTTATQDGGVEQQGSLCRLTDYVISLDFTITRPKIENEAVLPPADRALWQRMNDFILVHENEHKDVWLACAADIEKTIMALTAPNCDELISKGQAVWAEKLAACDRTQRKWDKDQASELMRQPFMRRALEEAK